MEAVLQAFVFLRWAVVLVLASWALDAQQSHSISTFAGGAPTPTPVNALDAAIQPNCVFVDVEGNVYFGSSLWGSSLSLFKVDANGTLVRIAGNSRRGFSGDGGPALDAQLGVSAITVASTGEVYVVDQVNNRIRKIAVDGVIDTIAGASYFGGYGGDGGPAVSASFSYLTGIALDRSGNLYIADSGNHRIRKISTDGVIHTIAGNGLSGNTGDGGPADQAAIGSGFFSIRALTIDAHDSLYIAVDNLVRKVTSDGIIVTVAGGEAAVEKGDGGLAVRTELSAPSGVAVDKAGNLFIFENWNYPRIRKVTVDGTITTIAGGNPGEPAGDGVPARQAALGGGSGVAVDSRGNVFVADIGANRIRRVSADGRIYNFAGSGLRYYLGDGGPAVQAQLDSPMYAAVDHAGNLVITEFGARRVRKVDAEGVITTIAGTGGPTIVGAVRNGQAARSASLGGVSGVAVDSQGNSFIADSNNACIWKVNRDGDIVRVAGTFEMGFSGDGGPASQAKLFTPWGLTLDKAGNLYIADENANRIRKVSSNGTISTVAGNGIKGFSGDGGPATQASLSLPRSVAVDSLGNLYIADQDNGRVRRVSKDGVITTFAGDGSFGRQIDEGLALSMPFGLPSGVAVDTSDKVYVSNGISLYKISPDGKAKLIAGNAYRIYSYSGDGGRAEGAEVAPYGVAVLPDGSVYVTDAYNGAIRLVRQTSTAPAQ